MTAATTTTTAPTAAGSQAAPPRLRRRPAFAALGVALVGFGGLAAAWLAASMDASTPVVVAAHDLYRGEVLAADDLTVANLGGLPAGSAITEEQLSATVGQTAITDLPAGMPVPPTSVSPQPVPGAGESVVGVKLAPGQLPMMALNPGDQVRVIATPRTQDDPPTSTPAGVPAVVASTGLDETTGHTVVNVVLPSNQAAAVAALAATGRVALVLDHPTAE